MCCNRMGEKQWKCEWDALPIEVINAWIDGIPDQVRRIIVAGGKNNYYG